MKNYILILMAISVVVMSSGCTLLTPEPWVQSDTRIIKNKKGEIVASLYTRRVTGFSKDPETANTWARADAIAQANTADNGKGARKNLTGIIINERRRSYYVRILDPDKNVITAFLMRPNASRTTTVPTYGKYYADWEYRGRRERVTMNVTPGVFVNVDGNEYGWFTRYPR